MHFVVIQIAGRNITLAFCRWIYVYDSLPLCFNEIYSTLRLKCIIKSKRISHESSSKNRALYSTRGCGSLNSNQRFFRQCLQSKNFFIKCSSHHHIYIRLHKSFNDLFIYYFNALALYQFSHYTKAPHPLKFSFQFFFKVHSRNEHHSIPSRKLCDGELNKLPSENHLKIQRIVTWNNNYLINSKAVWMMWIMEKHTKKWLTAVELKYYELIDTE